MKKKTEIAFLGRIEPAQCQCHKGQFLALIYLAEPGCDPEYITNVPFKTEDEAKKEMPNLLKAAADELLKYSGLDKFVVKTQHLNEEESQAIAEKFSTNGNTTLH